MGFVRTYTTKRGTRYQAMYDDAQGMRRSAGMYDKEKDAEQAWRRAESKIAEGLPWDPRRGRQTFRTYVEDKWLPHHRMEPSTRQDYLSAINRHIMPYFAKMKMAEIYPEHIRAWITWLKDRGVSPRRIQYCKTSILNAIFTTALNDHVIVIHPSRGITPTPSGEDPQELTRANHPDGKRFLVKQYPKNKRHRRLKLSTQITNKLKAYVQAKALKPDDLFFSRPPRQTTDRQLSVAVDPDEMKFTADNGRTYTHGSISAYNLAKCRCARCRSAYATYRANRRGQGKDNPRKPRTIDWDEHLARDWFRKKIWLPTCQAAVPGLNPRVHDLRHAHASWLLAGGAGLQVVKERLGHLKLATTEKYLHTTLPTA